MTYSKREEIFSKEYLSIGDIQELFGMGYDEAAKVIREIKRSLQMNEQNPRGLRLNVQGKIHVQDYFDYYGITDYARYVPAIRVVKEQAQ